MTYLYLGECRWVIDVGRPCIEALSGDLARHRFEMAALPAVMVRGHKPCEPRRFHCGISGIGRGGRDRYGNQSPLQRGPCSLSGGKMAFSPNRNPSQI